MRSDMASNLTKVEALAGQIYASPLIISYGLGCNDQNENDRREQDERMQRVRVSVDVAEAILAECARRVDERQKVAT